MSSNSQPTPIDPNEYDVFFERDTDLMSGLDCEVCGDYLCQDPDHMEVPMVVCPVCRGRGMDRWEEDSCPECWGEGEVEADRIDGPSGPQWRAG